MPNKTYKENPMDIDKATFKDKRRAVEAALGDFLKQERGLNFRPWFFVEDMDDDFVFFSYENEDGVFRVAYSYDDGVATLSGEIEAVNQVTEFVVSKSFAETLTDFATKVLSHFGPTQREAAPVETVTKSVDEEKRTALFVVLSPDEFDLHEDIYSEDEVEKACNNFNQHCMVANLFHRIETEKAVITQSFINPAEFEVDDGRVIKKGAWLQWWHFPEGNAVSDELWEGVKEGTFNGVSIQCRATVEELE